MSILKVHSLIAGQWVAPSSDARPIESAITGQIIAEAGSSFNAETALTYARDVGGSKPARADFPRPGKDVESLGDISERS